MQKKHDLGEKPGKTTLHNWQIEDLAFYINNPRCANLSDPGTGKTPSVCVYFQYLWEYHGEKTVWAMPKSLLKKNRDEILRFTDLREDHVQIIDGTPKQRLKQINNPEAVVFLMGFQRWRDDWRMFLEVHPEINLVAGDETHMGWKTVTSKTGEELLKSMKKIKRFLPMTGTLIDGSLETAYPVIKIIEPRYYANIWNFRNQHGIWDVDGNLIAWTNHEKLGRIFQRHAVRRRFRDIHGDVEEVIEKRLCQMSESQQEAYDQLEKDAFVELENEIIDGSLPGVNTIRARQIMAHPETFGIHKETDLTGKDEALLIDLEDHGRTGKPFLVFAALIPELKRINRICRERGFRVGYIDGSVPTKKRQEIDAQFKNGELDILTASPDTAAFGFNWGHVDHIAFASMNYQDSTFKQAKQRCIRGARDPLRISVYEYENSIDQRIFQVVDRKSRDANKVDNSYDELSLSKRPEPEGELTMEGHFT